MAKRILLCDDEMYILRAAEFKLSRAGFDVRCASDGEEGWEAINLELPDLVITDCQMPRLDGLGLAERIHGSEATRHIPVIMLTAKGFERSYRETAEQWHVRRVLAKPFSPRELLKIVEEYLGPALPKTAEVSA